MKDLYDLRYYHSWSGQIEFIRPVEFLSKIKIKVIQNYKTDIESGYPNYNSDVFFSEDSVGYEITYKTKKYKLKQTKGLHEWHAFSRLFTMIRKQIEAPYLCSEATESQLLVMAEEFLSPKYALILSPTEYFPFDPESFTYYKTHDGKKGELVFNRRPGLLASVKLASVYSPLFERSEFTGTTITESKGDRPKR